MAVYPQVSVWILIVTSVTLFWVALTDFPGSSKIPNEMVLALVGLYVLYSLVSGQRATMPWNIGFALLMLAGMIYAYWRQQMGGGDLKLLAAAFLWTGPWYAAVFSVLLLIFVAIHYAAARLGWAAVQRSAIELAFPLAPAVAAALIGTFTWASLGRLKSSQLAANSEALRARGPGAPRARTMASHGGAASPVGHLERILWRDPHALAAGSA